MKLDSNHYSHFYQQLEFECVHFDLLQFDESGGKPRNQQRNENRMLGIKVKFQSQDLTTAISLVFVTLFIYAMLHKFYEVVADMFHKSVLMLSVQDMSNQDMWVFSC